GFGRVPDLFVVGFVLVGRLMTRRLVKASFDVSPGRLEPRRLHTGCATRGSGFSAGRFAMSGFYNHKAGIDQV
ncbi:MAG TPA: hypothetical protein PKH32_11785, partial [Verrucomicrobiota bacterium]|nr:hypothetical protein [Verrucomicrobiota bacterium]